jgi:threonylcarbamoyladenosine tRNA methylthiotransferase MtaB
MEDSDSLNKRLQMSPGNRKPQTANPLFRVITFGCKVNQCDSAGMAGELSELGWSPAPPGAVPDLVVVNTCTVTKRADQQARQTVRRLAREHPGVPVWVTGCYAQRDPAALAALPGVRAVFGNQEKTALADILNKRWGNPGLAAAGGGEAVTCEKAALEAGKGFEGQRVLVKTFAAAPPWQPLRVRGALGQTRARLKIQEGCSHRCSYCIVPTVRGPRRSLGVEAVLAAFQELGDLGYREVVLTGVDLGQYGLDHTPPGSLAALVRRLTKTFWPFRVRLSSLEPQMVTPELLEALADWPNFCPHFHLPLQSGAKPVLAAMGRPYGPGEFRDLVDEITRRFPGAGLGLDVLVGFPGETDSDFAASRDLVTALPVTYLHVFPYSPRPGTPAATLQPLPGKVVKERARIMRDLGRQKKQQFQTTQLGQVREVLVEGPAVRPGYLQGLTDHYLRVALPGPGTWRNRLIKVRLEARQGEMLIGEAVDHPG